MAANYEEAKDNFLGWWQCLTLKAITKVDICQNSAHVHLWFIHIIFVSFTLKEKNYKQIKFWLIIHMLKYLVESILIYVIYFEMH